MIYLDNAATALQRPQRVVDAVAAAMTSFGNPGRGAHGAALSAERTVFAARQAVAELFGCKDPKRVVFTANATEALNIALNGLVSPGDHVISTDLEHNSVLRPLYRLQAQGAEVDFLPADAQGRLDYTKLEILLKKNTKAVVCTHASNLTGDMPDIKCIADFCKTHGLLLVTDASQTAGCMPVSMDALGADVLCFTGHKGLLGPPGTGGLCLRTGVEAKPWCVGGSGAQSALPTQPQQYPARLEAGTRNGHGLAGLLEAVRETQERTPEAIHKKTLALARRFTAQVRALPGVAVYGDWDTNDRAAITALNIGDLSSGEAADLLWERWEIAVRPGLHCAPRLHRALGTLDRGAVRFSFGRYNTEEEIDAAARAVEELSKL